MLHLDQADHYGGAWSSLSWEQLQLLAASPEQDGGLFDAACGTAANADLGRLSSYAFDLALRVIPYHPYFRLHEVHASTALVSS